MKKKRFTTVLIILIISLILATYVWYRSDSIGKSALSTHAKLLIRPMTGNDEIVIWLEKNHGEAPNQQVMNTFVSWGIKNKSAFEAIISSVSQKTLDRVVWAISDVAASDVYLKAFSGSKSANMKYIINKIGVYYHDRTNI